MSCHCCCLRTSKAERFPCARVAEVGVVDRCPRAAVGTSAIHAVLNQHADVRRAIPAADLESELGHAAAEDGSGTPRDRGAVTQPPGVCSQASSDTVLGGCRGAEGRPTCKSPATFRVHVVRSVTGQVCGARCPTASDVEVDDGCLGQGQSRPAKHGRDRQSPWPVSGNPVRAASWVVSSVGERALSGVDPGTPPQDGVVEAGDRPSIASTEADHDLAW